MLVPPIGQGVGEAETLLFLDGNHSQVRTHWQTSRWLDWMLQVSVVTKIFHSPFFESVCFFKVFFCKCIFWTTRWLNVPPGFSCDQDCSLSWLVCWALQRWTLQQRWLCRKPCGGGLIASLTFKWQSSSQKYQQVLKVPVFTCVSNALKAFPLDAGTDNGFTFTSPNWETEPRGEVFQITNRFLLLRPSLIPSTSKNFTVFGQISKPPSQPFQWPT